MDRHIHAEDLAQTLSGHRLLGGSLKDDPALTHGDDPVRPCGGHIDVMHDNHDRALELVGGSA
jgi:hypothetical protein